MPKENEVKKPMILVNINAFGTARWGCRASSARCMAPSRPRNIEAGVAKPVMNVTPSGQPILFVKFSHTKEDDALCDRTRDVTDTVKKTIRLRPTFG
jgi:hypothetical protein